MRLLTFSLILAFVFGFFGVTELLGRLFPQFLPTPWDWVRGWYIKWAARYIEWRLRRRKFIWQCLRDGGGGVLRTPKPMTEEAAIRWLMKRTNGEIFFVEHDYHSILYRSRV